MPTGPGLVPPGGRVATSPLRVPGFSRGIKATGLYRLRRRNRPGEGLLINADTSRTIQRLRAPGPFPLDFLLINDLERGPSKAEAHFVA